MGKKTRYVIRLELKLTCLEEKYKKLKAGLKEVEYNDLLNINEDNTYGRGRRDERRMCAEIAQRTLKEVE